MADRVRSKDRKSCGVCGDNALGSNFNAVTCESCKAFFRRNALKPKDFKCPFEDNCKVDVVTRRFCQKCRLKKCLAVGMKKEWIMSEDEKKAKRAKIQQNREKRFTHTSMQIQDLTYVKAESPGDTHILSPISTISPLTPQTPGSMDITAELPRIRSFSHQPLTPSDCEYSPAKITFSESASESSGDSDILEEVMQEGVSVDDSTEHISDVEMKHSVKHFKSESSEFLEFDTSQRSKATKSLLVPKANIQTSPSKIEEKISDTAYVKAVELEFTELPIRTSLLNTKELNALEKQKLDELLVANEVLKMPFSGINDPSLLDVINMTDHAIRRLIKMSKRIVAFKNLCQEDQISLLKGGCTEMMILRSVMFYDPEKDCWRGPKGPKIMSIKVDVLKEAKGNLYEEHKRFITSFRPEWRTDENIIYLLSVIALFTPERPNTVHKDAIKLEQDTYYYLLRRYLDSIYEGCEAKTVYLKLIQKIQELHILNENHVRVYLDVNPKDVEPLLIEIFDLKH